METTMVGKAIGLIGILVIFMVVSPSCTTPIQVAEKSLADGDYAGAIEASLEALGQEHGLIDAHMILGEAWRRANAEWTSEIENLAVSEDVWQVDKAIEYYDALIHIHTIVKDGGQTNLNPSADPESWSEKKASASLELAEMHVFEGSKLLVSEARDEAKIAVVHYRRAKELEPDYPDIDDKLERAKELAVAKVFVFTGPEKDVTINGIDLVRAIEDGLDALDGVDVVRVPNRYAAPIDDNHDADEFAKGHKANMMLHIEPATTRTIGLVRESEPLKSVPWERESLRLEASATTEIRYVLIDLQNDTIVFEGTFQISDSDDGGFRVSAIHHGNGVESVNLGEQVGSRDLAVNFAPVGKAATGLTAEMEFYDDIEIPYDVESALGIPVATYGTLGKINVGEYSHPSELARIADLNGHTFWLFDAIAYDTYGDGQLSFQLVYERAFEEGIVGSLSAASYEENLYRNIEGWMKRADVQREVMDRFFPDFYAETVPSRIVKEVANLF